jgi:hypothetical protein
MNVLSLSYGKDSLACLGACEELGIKIDRIVHAEVWATDTIPADLPPMVEFKKHADKIIKERYGIEVEHYRADLDYESGFYHKIKPETIAKRKEKGKHISKYQQYDDERAIWGFPIVLGPWCNSKLKMEAIKIAHKSFTNCSNREQDSEIVHLLGIAADEPKRIERHTQKGKRLPLVEIGWTEAMCRKWCEENDLLSPIYTTATRGGCWFCHNQGVDQLRLLRRDYPELWALLMKWDNDSPVTFRPDGHTVHDFDRRFQAEDNGIILPNDRTFRWSLIDGEVQIKFF